MKHQKIFWFRITKPNLLELRANKKQLLLFIGINFVLALLLHQFSAFFHETAHITTAKILGATILGYQLFGYQPYVAFAPSTTHQQMLLITLTPFIFVLPLFLYWQRFKKYAIYPMYLISIIMLTISLLPSPTDISVALSAWENNKLVANGVGAMYSGLLVIVLLTVITRKLDEIIKNEGLK